MAPDGGMGMSRLSGETRQRLDRASSSRVVEMPDFSYRKAPTIDNPSDDITYHIIIVGAGILGSALAHHLTTKRDRNGKLVWNGRNVLLIERDWSEPDRIVGELLQPGGMRALAEMGLESCAWNAVDWQEADRKGKGPVRELSPSTDPEALEALESVVAKEKGIGSIEVHGYVVYYNGQPVRVPYPTIKKPCGKLPIPEQEAKGIFQGRSYHHGRFIQALRTAALASRGVYPVEGSASSFRRCEKSGRVIGVNVRAKTGETKTYVAPLSIIADGCFSTFRKEWTTGKSKLVVRSNFVGLLLRDLTLPYPHHGHVIMNDGLGPTLLYQIGDHDTRCLVDVPGKKMMSQSNGELENYLQSKVLPNLPDTVQPAFRTTLGKAFPSDRAAEQSDRIRSMPNSWLPSTVQGGIGSVEGAILAGDAWNMRHPLTGGGMSIALNDAVLLTKMVNHVTDSGKKEEALDDWDMLREGLFWWHWERKKLSGVINVLAQALYSLFSANDENMQVLQEACFKYFQLGGKCVEGPVSLLAAITPSPLLLFGHFFAVALYGIWTLFAHPRPLQVLPWPISLLHSQGAIKKRLPTPLDWPGQLVQAVLVFYSACVVFLPLLWEEWFL